MPKKKTEAERLQHEIAQYKADILSKQAQQTLLQFEINDIYDKLAESEAKHNEEIRPKAGFKFNLKTKK